MVDKKKVKLSIQKNLFKDQTGLTNPIFYNMKFHSQNPKLDATKTTTKETTEQYKRNKH